jgi:hypothetical protein
MAQVSSHRDTTRQAFIWDSHALSVSSPLFSALTRACADDDEIMDMCSVTRRGQAAGNLLMCVTQYLLMKSPERGLSRYFPSMTDSAAPASEAFPAFREFCLERRAEVMDLLSWRTVNTNVVEKSSCLLPALRYVDLLSSEPMTLLEICCSSGMNLLFDDYHYDYGPAGQLGKEDSPIRLSCKVIGGSQPPLDAIPTVVERVGVDLVTVDVSDPLERLWMEAVLPPEWRSERERLRAALSIRAKRDFRTIRGDALEVLPSLLDQLPGSLCILQSYCIGHWSATARRELDELLRGASRQRDIHRLAVEGNEDEPPTAARRRLIRLAEAGIPVLQKSSPSCIDHIRYTNNEATVTRLGEGSIFGYWLDWQAQAPN